MSTAVVTRLLRCGMYSRATGIDSDALDHTVEPDTYGHVTRTGLRVRWLITAGKTGPTLTAGRTWTRGGAWVEAIAAAHKPGPTAGAR